MSKSTIIKGTMILTITGLVTRIIGFFYKIYLSNLIGARNLGVYQLIFPVYGICFTLYASGIQTALSKLVAEETGKGEKGRAKRILACGIVISVSIALILSVILYMFSDFIAVRLLLEADCASSLRILAFVFPFCGVTSCINGYYYGLKKASVPAITQLIEQIFRVTAVIILVNFFPSVSISATCEMAVFGIVVGEIASQLYNLISLIFTSKKSEKKNEKDKKQKKSEVKSKTNPFYDILSNSLPLTINRLLMSILHSFEAILIPNMLKQSGLSTAEALTLYGILNGMVMSFIMFPSTITNSLSVLLLPTISEAKARNNETVIASTTAITIKYSIILGIFSMAFFLTFGNDLGNLVYHEPRAGIYLTILAWICPFLYITTTLNSIINGLGKMNLAFFTSIILLGLRIVFICVLIPKYGMRGYFISLLISQLLITLCDYTIIKKHISFTLDVVASIVKPSMILYFCCDICSRIYEFLLANTQINQLILLLATTLLLCIAFVLLLIVTKTISIKELKQAT